MLPSACLLVAFLASARSLDVEPACDALPAEGPAGRGDALLQVRAAPLAAVEATEEGGSEARQDTTEHAVTGEQNGGLNEERHSPWGMGRYYGTYHGGEQAIAQTTQRYVQSWGHPHKVYVQTTMMPQKRSYAMRTLYDSAGKKESQADFNRLFREHSLADSGVIVRECDDCASTHKKIYIHVNQPATWNAYDELLTTWTAAGFRTKFNLYSKWDGDKPASSPWTFCDGNDPGIGFPRDCGPTGSVSWQWTSLTRGGQQNYRYYVIALKW